MTIVKTKLDRRSFIRSSVLAGGGMFLGFNWLAASCSTKASEEGFIMPENWIDMNGYLKIGENGVVTIMSPNPEIGQNVKTSMPMIVAEELDIDWAKVVVEQAPLNTAVFNRQVAGGSQSIRANWNGLRTVGATARRMLQEAAAQKWGVPVEEVTTDTGILYHKNSGKKIGYGEIASEAALLPVPEEVKLKEVKDFKIVGTSRKNVDGHKIVTGQPLFGIDYKKEGMLIAMIVHAPAFGMKLKSFDATDAKAMPGIKDVFSIKGASGRGSESESDDLVVVVGNSTWEVMNAKIMLNIDWEPASDKLESTADHNAKMAAEGAKKQREVRKDGDPEKAFKNAARIIERTYTAPFLAHNTMEPMNFFAHVTDNKVELAGPIQTPASAQSSVSQRLGIPIENVTLELTRIGGGFGRRLSNHYAVEAAVISQKVNAPVKLIYSREDDMTFGIYRPAYHALYRAALDADNNLIGFHVRMGGIPQSPLHANRFPAGAVDNYLAETWSLNSDITVGAFRAPGSNFNAVAEQSFLDELAKKWVKIPFSSDLIF